jgi:hypothetical protein
MTKRKTLLLPTLDFTRRELDYVLAIAANRTYERRQISARIARASLRYQFIAIGARAYQKFISGS